MFRTLTAPNHLPAVAVLARPQVRLLLTSSVLLFVELLLIRWIPANVKYVGFFSNFVLMASFLGIGVGILLGRRRQDLALSPFPVLLLLLVLLVTGAQLNVQVPAGDQIFFGLAESTSADANFVVLLLVIVLVTALMATLSLPLGPLLRAMPPLQAYAIDITGSMLGIAAFAIVSVLSLGPVVWFSLVGVVLLALALGVGPTAWSMLGGACMILVVVASAAVATASHDAWSPYYRISAFGADDHIVSTDPRDGQQPVFLSVDGIPHQTMMTAAQAAESALHQQVYRWFPGRTFENVLIVGAGSGSDTALALAKGAGHIDAVEIDPELARIGRQFHPEHVYADPRVTLAINDGRAFLRGTTSRYDLIIFALTDSLTLVTSTGSVRLESFLFTDEALASARDHLTPNGVFLMYNLYREPWLVTKLDRMASDVFGHQPLLKLIGPTEAVIAAGPAVAVTGSVPAGDAVDPVPAVDDPAPRPATDDWPFLYLRTPQIAAYYLFALAFLLVFAVVVVAGALKVSGTGGRRMSPHFFVLGVAFLLLETKSLVSFSLLFGTTWLVNAMAFFAILASVLLAIVVNQRYRPRRPRVLYGALLVAIAIAWLLPADSLLIDPPQLRYLVAGAIAFAPVFFANLVFAYSFRDTAAADLAFASNLLGAMVGGALEYVALLTGFQALLVIVAVLYVAAWLLATRWRLLADVELEARAPLAA
ncbi:MAG: spermidine synthase [Candidatus Limnocylindrales bacterium]